MINKFDIRKKKLFDSDSVIDENTNIDYFIPPNQGWNYIRLLDHPEDYFENKRNDTCGKWLIFVPDNDFINVFRKLAKLTKELQLTSCFKASGKKDDRGLHVFCVYCMNYRNIKFIRKIAEVLLKEGFLIKYGYKYKNDNTYALFFKTDETTHYKSKASGEHLTLFRYTNINQLFVKEFINDKPNWKLVEYDEEKGLTENFEMHLDILSMNDLNISD